jgi:hypothetical protein
MMAASSRRIEVIYKIEIFLCHKKRAITLGEMLEFILQATRSLRIIRRRSCSKCFVVVEKDVFDVGEDNGHLAASGNL